jgi:hypothetical protein
MGRKSLVQFETETRELKALKSTLHVVMRGSDGAFRIEQWDDNNCPIGGGTWVAQRMIATFDKDGHHFFAVSEYHKGTFPVEKVLEWR